MSDSTGGGIGSMIAEAAKAVAEPIKDEIGQAIETGVQSVVGTAPTPQDPATAAATDVKKNEEEQKKAEYKWIIEKNKRLETELQVVRQKKAAEEQKTQEANQQQEQVKQYKAVEKTQQRDNMARQVQEAKTRSETRKGVGG